MADIDVNQIIAAAMAQQGQGATAVEDMPLIPLWQVRPPSTSGNAGSSAAADHSTAPISGTGAGSAALADRYITDQPARAGDADGSVTMSAAEGHWMDMTAEERMAFAAAAEKAGVWKKSLGADALFQAWGKAVGWAAKYNGLHKDNKRMWLSPFEAVTNMQIAGMADDDLDHDGFSTESTVQQFTTHDLRMQAKQILQSELGRNPTDSEMKAYTAAVNAAARLNPRTTTTQQVINPDGSRSSDSVVTGGMDEAAVAGTIQDMAGDTQEAADYKTAAMYLPALQQAIGASIHM